MEIWNNVFMEFNKLPDWKLVNLPDQNVDTGMWLERITATLNTPIPQPLTPSQGQGEKMISVYDTDIFEWIIKKIENEIWVEYNEKTMRSIRIIADHARTVTLMISDWAFPSNIDQGYILRRLARRAIRQAYILGFKWPFLYNVADAVIDKLWPIYTNLIEKKEEIKAVILKEEKQFWETLEKWLKEFDKLIISLWNDSKIIPWDKAFRLFDTYGFPIEMTQELAEEKWLKVDITEFIKAYEKHQELSRTATAGKFKWWLADSSGETVALHSAAHLLLAGLRKYLWENVHQRWSNITPERIRFDFSNEEKVEREILDKIEEFVNNAISSWFEVKIENISKEEAKASWVEWSFWEKYPDIVKVYTFIWNDWTIYSRELCWWPHVENSKELWRLKITKEESSSRGVRRVKAVLVKN
jgi:alanyl-tRNA synthetase